MSNETEVQYKDGDVVWVKLGPCWWPGEVHDANRVPPEIQPGLKKAPIAYVHFFQEDKYEYVKSVDHIHPYNGRRKKEFIKKGLDMHRAKQKHMDKFPMDVCTAEGLTDGDPDIITSDEFAPEQKVDYASLFGTPTNKKTPKRLGSSSRGSRGRKVVSPRIVPRRPLNINLDYDVHFLGSKDELEIKPPHPGELTYKCHLCNFQSGRVNVLIMHRKSHTGNDENYGNKGTKKRGPKKPKLFKMTPCSTSSIDEDLELLSRGVDIMTYDNGVKRKSKMLKTPKRQKLSTVTGGDLQDSKTTNVKLLRDNLLADWDDSDGEKEKDETADTVDAADRKVSTSDINISGVNILINLDDSKDAVKEKSCFDFEEEEEATIISKSPGRKIPRVIPENQKPKSPLPVGTIQSNRPSDQDSVVSKTETGKPDNIAGKSKRRGGRKQKIKATTDVPTVEEVEKKVTELNEEDFDTLMQETVLAEIPSLPDDLLAGKSDPVSSDTKDETVPSVDEEVTKSTTRETRRTILKRNKIDSPVTVNKAPSTKDDKIKEGKQMETRQKVSLEKEEISNENLNNDKSVDHILKDEKLKEDIDKYKDKDNKQKEEGLKEEGLKEEKTKDDKVKPLHKETQNTLKEGKRKSLVKESLPTPIKESRRKLSARESVLETKDSQKSGLESALVILKEKRKSVLRDTSVETPKETVRKSTMKEKEKSTVESSLKDKRKSVLQDKSPEPIRENTRKSAAKETSGAAAVVIVSSSEQKLVDENSKGNRRKIISKEPPAVVEVVPKETKVDNTPKILKRKPLFKELKFEQALQESDTVYLPKSMKLDDGTRNKRKVNQKEKTDGRRKPISKDIIADVVIPERKFDDTLRASKRKTLTREHTHESLAKVSKTEEVIKEIKQSGSNEKPTTTVSKDLSESPKSVAILDQILTQNDVQFDHIENVPVVSSVKPTEISEILPDQDQIPIVKSAKSAKSTDLLEEISEKPLVKELTSDKVNDAVIDKKIQRILQDSEKEITGDKVPSKSVETLDEILSISDEKQDDSVKVMISLNDFKMEDIPLPSTGYYIPKRKDSQVQNLVSETQLSEETEEKVDSIKEKPRTPIKFEISKMKAQLNKKLKHTHRSFLVAEDDELASLRKGHSSRSDTFRTSKSMSSPIESLPTKEITETKFELNEDSDVTIPPYIHKLKLTEELSQVQQDQSQISQRLPELTEPSISVPLGQLEEEIKDKTTDSVESVNINISNDEPQISQISLEATTRENVVTVKYDEDVKAQNSVELTESITTDNVKPLEPILMIPEIEEEKDTVIDNLQKESSILLEKDVVETSNDSTNIMVSEQLQQLEQLPNFSSEECLKNVDLITETPVDDVTEIRAESVQSKEVEKHIESITSFATDDVLNNGILDVVKEQQQVIPTNEDNILSILEEKTELGTDMHSGNSLNVTTPQCEQFKVEKPQKITDYVDEFESIENEIQKITSSQMIHCKASAFPENIAITPTRAIHGKDVLSPTSVSDILNKDLYSSHLTSESEPNINLTTDSKVANDNSIESEIAKLTDTKPEEGEILPTQTYSTTSSKLLEILESKSEKTKIEKKFVPVTMTDSKQKFVGLTAAQKKTVALGGKMISPKTTKFVIKSAGIKDNVGAKKTSKPIILSEEIIKPANDGSNASTQVITKRTYEDDIAKFIIEKPTKKLVVDTSSQQSAVTPKTSRTKPTILSQTIITSAGRIIDGSASAESTKEGDDNMFDINSMPIVLSDDLFTAESIEKMPIVISNVADCEKQGKTVQLINKSGKIQPEKTKIVGKQVVQSVIHHGLSKNQKVYQTGSTKMLSSKPAVITQPGKPGKFIILPSSSASVSSGSKYTVGKRPIRAAPHQSVVMKTSTNTVSSSSAVFDQKMLKSNPQTGNKIMLLTDARGQQSRILLSPAQHKMIGTKMGTKIVARNQIGSKGTTLALNNIVTSKGDILTPTSTLVQSKISQSPQTLTTSKGQLLTSVHSQSIITSKGQILTPVTPNQMKALKTGTNVASGKKIQLQSQKIILPASSPKTSTSSIAGIKTKTVVVKGAQRQIVQKIQMSPGTSRQLGSIVQKQTQLKPIMSTQIAPQGSKQKVTIAPKTANVIKRQVIKSHSSIGQPHQRIILQKVSPDVKTSGLQRAQHKIETPKTFLKHDRASSSIVNPNVPPLVPLSPSQSKATELPAQPTPSVSSVHSTDTPVQTPKQLIIQDDMGNQTSITQGQILAVPGGEVVEGQPQSYMLVTVDESGNLLPLDNQALMALDPTLIGPDGNVMLKFDQGLPNTDMSQSTISTPAPPPLESLEMQKTQAIESTPTSQEYQQLLITDDQQNLIALSGTDQQLLMTHNQNLLLTNQSVLQEPKTTSSENRVTYSIANAEDGQQILISGDPEKAQHFINALTSGTQDLSQIISGTEGNLIINADGQQIILNTDGGGNEQLILAAPTDSFGLQENYNADFVTQATTNQDILAAALANTDVFQQDSAITESLNIVTSATGGPLMATASELSPSLYQNMQLPNLATNAVLETSLTNMAPIMSPLEVPTSGTSKKVPLDIETSSQVPKSLELPITITDPNISQTVSSQQLANELQNNLGLPITITDPNISNVRVSELNTTSYGYSLPSIEDSVEAVTTASSGPISMPLLTEDIDGEAPHRESTLCTSEKTSDSPKGLSLPLTDIFEQSRDTHENSTHDLEKSDSALEVLANVTTASGMINVSDNNSDLDQIFADKKEDQLPAEVFAQSTFLSQNELDTKSNDSEGNVNESFARSRLADHFVLESPQSEIDANSDEISIQPSIMSDETNHPIHDNNSQKRNFAECNLDDDYSESKKIKFDNTS